MNSERLNLYDLALIVALTAVMLVVGSIVLPKKQQSGQVKSSSILTTNVHKNTVFEKITIEGHEYLVIDKIGIVHSETCPCRKK